MRISHPNLDWPAACHTTWRASFLSHSYAITEPRSHSSLILVVKNVAQLEERVDAKISWQTMAEMNVAETQVDVVATAWKNAEAGYDELSGGLSLRPARTQPRAPAWLCARHRSANDAAFAASLQANS